MKNSLNDIRLLELSDLLASYSMGNFVVGEIKLSKDLDEIDTIISGVNMLGEELRSTTISRDFFSSVYNAVTDMLLVVSKEGIIEDKNEASDLKLQEANGNLAGRSINELCAVSGLNLFKKINVELENEAGLIRFESAFRSANGLPFPVIFTCSKIITRSGEFKGFLVAAEDITEKKANEKAVVRAIMETQEKERQRVADDLHDSLGQELSTIKMLISSIDSFGEINDQIHSATETCVNLLDQSISNLRSICFNLMPSSLAMGSLIHALDQLVKTIRDKGNIEIWFDTTHEQLPLEKNQEIAVYRAVQEFINNTFKHANATEIDISIVVEESAFKLAILDNGVGFNMDKQRNHVGRGMSTMKSRIESFHGTAELTSKIGDGTKLLITFNVNP